MLELIDEYNLQRGLWDEGEKMKSKARQRINEIMQEIGEKMSELKKGDIINMEGGNRYEIAGVSANEINDGAGKKVWKISLSGFRISKKDGKRIGRNIHGIYGKWTKEERPYGKFTAA